MSFWSDDINAADALSPRDIMISAGDELASRTKTLKVSIQETRLSDRIVLGFEIINDKHALTLKLFEASHSPDHSYPVVIAPPTSDIPEFLQVVTLRSGDAWGSATVNIADREHGTVA